MSERSVVLDLGRAAFSRMTHGGYRHSGNTKSSKALELCWYAPIRRYRLLGICRVRLSRLLFSRSTLAQPNATLPSPGFPYKTVQNGVFS